VDLDLQICFLYEEMWRQATVVPEFLRRPRND
jgi:hypothetical protein